MANWYYKVCQDLTNIPDCIEYYKDEMEQARKDLHVRGKKIEEIGSKLPGIVEHRFGQLQEIEAILEYLNIQQKKVKTEKFRKYLEHYNKTLSSRDADKFSDGDPDVINMAILVNEFAMVRNKYLALMKGYDQTGWMIGHITRLRCAGLDDATMG